MQLEINHSLKPHIPIHDDICYDKTSQIKSHTEIIKQR